MMWNMLAATHPEEAHILDSMAMEKMGKSLDIKEGIASFLEKRDPNFPMKVSKVPVTNNPSLALTWRKGKFCTLSFEALVQLFLSKNCQHKKKQLTLQKIKNK